MLRNGWPEWSGMGGRNQAEYPVATLVQQEQYFEYTDSFLAWVNFEGRRVAGKPSTPQQPAPKQIERPSLYIHYDE